MDHTKTRRPAIQKKKKKKKKSMGHAMGCRQWMGHARSGASVRVQRPPWMWEESRRTCRGRYLALEEKVWTRGGVGVVVVVVMGMGDRTPRTTRHNSPTEGFEAGEAEKDSSPSHAAVVRA